MVDIGPPQQEKLYQLDVIFCQWKRLSRVLCRIVEGVSTGEVIVEQRDIATAGEVGFEQVLRCFACVIIPGGYH